MSEQHNADTIDIRSIFRKIASKWWWFVITISLSLAAGVAIIKTTPKAYKVQAVMMMGDKSRTAFGGNQEEFIKGSSFLRSSADLEDQVAVLTSRSNMERALRRLDFGVSYYETTNFLTTEKYEHPPFIVKLDTVAVQVVGIPVQISVDRGAATYRVQAKGKNVMLYNVGKEDLMEEYVAEYNVDKVVPIGEPFVDQNLSFTVEFPEDRVYSDRSTYFFQLTSLDDLVLGYRGKTSAEPLGKESNIVVLQVKGEVVAKERAFLNKLMETYIEGEKFKQEQKGLKTINFIEDQIGTVSDSLRRVESSIEQFRFSSGGVMDVSRSNEALSQEKSRLNDERSLVLRKRNYCSNVLTKIRSTSDLRNMPTPGLSGIDDAVLNNLVMEITKLAGDLAAANATTGARSNPALISMERRMKNLTATLEQTAESLVEQADISLAEIDRRISRINFQSGQLPREERTLVNYERKFKLSDNLYNYLMEKRAEAGIAIASNQVDKVVIDPARMEGKKAIAPDKKVILGGAFLLGLFLPLMVILIRDMVNDRIADPDELKRLTKIPVLALIPSSKKRRIIGDDLRSVLAEAFRTARINLQYLNPGSKRQVIGFTSSSSGEGKTFCAVNMATIMANAGRRTIVIDADLRRPNLARTMEMSEEGVGLSTWLIGECAVDAMIKKTDVPGLDIITSGPIPPNPLELMESPMLSDLVEKLRERYDRIIFDCSPLGLVSEYVVLMRHVDLTLYVVRQGYTKRGALRLINEMYAEKQMNNVDLLLNDVKIGQGYGEGYGYYTK